MIELFTTDYGPVRIDVAPPLLRYTFIHYRWSASQSQVQVSTTDARFDPPSSPLDRAISQLEEHIAHGLAIKIGS